MMSGRRFLLSLGLLVLSAVAASAQPASQRAVVTGTVTARHAAGAIVGATVTLEETGQAVETGADGRYRLEDLAPGTYHLKIAAASFAPLRREIVVTSAPLAVDIAL